MKYDLDIIVPVFREEGNISKTIEEIFKISEINFRVLIVYDFDEDPTIQVIKNNFDKSQIICLDGDGSVLMHLGTLRTIGYLKNKNFKHIILNNNSHESVGGQPTYAKDINFKNISSGLGYKNFFQI